VADGHVQRLLRITLRAMSRVTKKVGLREEALWRHQLFFAWTVCISVRLSGLSLAPCACVRARGVSLGLCLSASVSLSVCLSVSI
jgi:hypothetical protein